MASRSKQKRSIPKGKECNENKMSIYNLLALIISAISVVISGFALFTSNNYSRMEYAYKVDPRIEVTASIEARKNPVPGGAPLTAVTDMQVSILEKNNLDQAFLLHAGSSNLEKLELDNLENILAGKFESGLDSSADIISGKWEYRYAFVYLESLDGSGKLYLLYTKTTPGEVEFRAYSGIEVYGLANKVDEDEDAKTGAQLMARNMCKFWLNFRSI